MNQKQGLKLHIKELEEIITEKDKEIFDLKNYNSRAKRDIVTYNHLLLNMIDGGNPCEMCEERRLGECENPELDGKGCQSWWLKDMGIVQEEGGEEDNVQIEGSLPDDERQTD